MNKAAVTEWGPGSAADATPEKLLELQTWPHMRPTEPESLRMGTRGS